MKILIRESQYSKLIDIIQQIIDRELVILKKYADDDELSYGDTYQVNSINKIIVVRVERLDGWAIWVDIRTKNSNCIFFNDVLDHISISLRDYIGMNAINEI